MGDLVNISSQFKGLPMEDLIGGPLIAVANAETMLARTTADFINTVGFEPDTGGTSGSKAAPKARMMGFEFLRPVEINNGTADKPDITITQETVRIEMPLLALVKIPCVGIDTVDISFDMEVKSSTKDDSSSDKSGDLSGTASVGWGPFKASVTVHGSVSSHEQHTRESDNSAKYHVEVHARDFGTPEGLARVLDLMNACAAPMKITPPSGVTPASNNP